MIATTPGRIELIILIKQELTHHLETRCLSLAEIDTLVFIFSDHKGPGKRGHIVADTLLPMTFLRFRKLGNICCGHKMFLNKIRNVFCVPETKFVYATNAARADKRGIICVRNNVSSFASALTYTTS